MAKKKNQNSDVYTDRSDFASHNKVVNSSNNSIVIGGNANGNIIIAGNGNVLSSNENANLEALQALLKEIHLAVSQTKLDPDMTKVLEADFDVVETQLEKPEPKKTIVLPKLESIVGMLTSTAAASEAIQKLKPLIQQAIEWVKVLF